MIGTRSSRARGLLLVVAALTAVLARPAPAVADEAPGGEIELEVGPNFILEDGTDLREVGGPSVRNLLIPRRGRGTRFGATQKERYCRLKESPDRVQWVLNDLETGDVLSRSPGAERLFFGASTSKVFVAAALLDKQKGKFTAEQLRLLTRMIVVSDNGAWRALQRQVGDGSDDRGRARIQAFTRRMGYPTIQGFQGWMRRPDGSREHGNELNADEVARFLQDTSLRNYPGAEVLWKILQATRTGGSKIDKYTPPDVFIAGKTGTYSGPNESPDTVKLPTIQARNHAAAVTIRGRRYGLAILTNTGHNEDVAVLAGGLQREYLGLEPRVTCD